MPSLSDNYFNYTRKEIAPLLPSTFDRVLEIGCASGGTLCWLRDEFGCSWVGGVELDNRAAGFARSRLDYLAQSNIEHELLDIEESSVDLLLCLDVFEHLYDPWSAIAKLNRYVRPGGVIIASIPNIRHKSVVLPLLFKGSWNYADEGILDRTHLRFFVRDTAIALIELGDFTIDKVLATGLGRSRRSQSVNACIPEWIKGLFVKQYLLRGVKP